MAEQPEPLDIAQLKRQARSHLNSLRSAGVEWLPAAPPGRLQVANPVAASSTSALPPASEALSLLSEPASHTDLSLEERRTALKVLAGKVSGCSLCAELASTRTQTVFGDGGPGVELCFVGEAPGADEDAQGLPFVGAAGQLLNKIIAACGLKREEVYICNIIKCRPPGNRTPLPNEAAHCRPFLEEQIALVQPRFICALGGCAAQNLLGSSVPLGRLRGRFHDFKGIPVLCTYHPAYLLPHRSPHKKRDVWEDMKMLLARMGRAVPAR
jgi:DNA polymerase